MWRAASRRLHMPAPAVLSCAARVAAPAPSCSRVPWACAAAPERRRAARGRRGYATGGGDAPLLTARQPSSHSRGDRQRAQHTPQTTAPVRYSSGAANEAEKEAPSPEANPLLALGPVGYEHIAHFPQCGQAWPERPGADGERVISLRHPSQLAVRPLVCVSPPPRTLSSNARLHEPGQLLPKPAHLGEFAFSQGIAASAAVMAVGWYGAEHAGQAVLAAQGMTGASPISGIPFAILLGMGIGNTVSVPDTLKPGLKFCTTNLVRGGVAAPRTHDPAPDTATA